MVAESDGKIDMKIVLRENEELMNLFLTKAKSIPKLIVINKETGGFSTLGSKTQRSRWFN
jgi:hypothetical protein